MVSNKTSVWDVVGEIVEFSTKLKLKPFDVLAKVVVALDLVDVNGVLTSGDSRCAVNVVAFLAFVPTVVTVVPVTSATRLVVDRGLLTATYDVGSSVVIEDDDGEVELVVVVVVVLELVGTVGKLFAVVLDVSALDDGFRVCVAAATVPAAVEVNC